MSNASNSPSYDLFLAHGAPDKPWVRTLHALLDARGISAYLDEVAIDPGDSFVSDLGHGIGGTPTLVLVLSQGTADRPWVELEWTAFLATHGPRSTVIPVVLDAVALPAFLRPFQAIRAIDRDAVAVATRLIRAVGKRASLTALSPP